MGLSSFFNISDSEHNPVHIHYYTLLNPSLPPSLLPIQTFPTLHSNRAKHQKCLGLAFSNRPWTHYQDALPSWLAGTTTPHSITGQDWGGGKTSMTAAQAHNAPPSPPTVPTPKTPECQGETWRRIAEFANPSVAHRTPRYIPGHANRALRRQAPWLRAWWLFKGRVRGVPR